MTITAKQEGDVRLRHILDDGDIIIEDGVVEMNGGLETAAYLSLFGGNEDDNGRPDSALTWWGNRIESDASRRYVSELQHLMQSLPLITGNLHRIEDAARRDLNWFLAERIASSLDVAVSIPDVNRVDIDVQIQANGQQVGFRFTENWKLDFAFQLQPGITTRLGTARGRILLESGGLILLEGGGAIELEGQ